MQSTTCDCPKPFPTPNVLFFHHAHHFSSSCPICPLSLSKLRLNIKFVSVLNIKQPSDCVCMLNNGCSGFIFVFKRRLIVKAREVVLPYWFICVDVKHTTHTHNQIADALKVAGSGVQAVTGTLLKKNLTWRVCSCAALSLGSVCLYFAHWCQRSSSQKIFSSPSSKI